MNIIFFKSLILLFLYILVILPLPSVMAAGGFAELLQVMGISIAPHGVRDARSIDADSIIRGKLWVSKIDERGAHEPKPITRDGTYHSPLWIPDSNRILAVKENKLVQLEMDGSAEKILYPLSGSIILYGFDKRDTNSVLILQDSVPAMLSLSDGQIMLLPYDKKADRAVLERLEGTRHSRDYGHTKISIDCELIRDALNNLEEICEIHIKPADKREFVLPCDALCVQPALTENGRQLVFVGS